jgi:hypothetical protein
MTMHKLLTLMSERSRVSNEEEMKNAIRVTPIAKLAKQVIHLETTGQSMCLNYWSLPSY